MSKPPSLDEFVEENPSKPGFSSYLDTDLQPEVRQQLLDSKAGHADAERWLHKCYPEHSSVTQGMIGTWRRKNGWNH
jgi:hypothetical protein